MAANPIKLHENLICHPVNGIPDCAKCYNRIGLCHVAGISLGAIEIQYFLDEWLSYAYSCGDKAVEFTPTSEYTGKSSSFIQTPLV
jgi:hypothetical protein